MFKERKSLRLKDFDYGSDGAYFVTICTKNREHLFGEVVDGNMCLNALGTLVDKCWNDISQHYETVFLDEYVVMPNHIHGIIFVGVDVVGDEYLRPINQKSNLKQAEDIQPLRRLVRLGNIIKGFKIGVTKWARIKSDVYDVWQRSYHDRIIRNDEELNKIRDYIVANPEKWEEDDYF